MPFEFATAARVVFGPGALHELNPAQFGRRAFVAGGRNTARLDPLLQVLKQSGVEFVTFAVEGEPSIELVSKGVEARVKAAAIL